MDAAIASLFEAAMGSGARACLVAVGGYGRGELAPYSDVDVIVLTGAPDAVVEKQMRALLYPLWDAGFQVGHAVLSPRDAIERARSDLHAATSLLSARPVTGDGGLCEELTARRDRWLDRERKQLARRILRSMAQRHEGVDRAGWALAPDLKEGIGGLRDVHALEWLQAVGGETPNDGELRSSAEVLLAAREALHAEARRKLEHVRLDLQPGVAHRLGLDGDSGVEALMTEVHSAARTIEWLTTLGTDAAVDAILAGPRRSGSARAVARDVRLEDSHLKLEEARRKDPAAVMRLLAAKARGTAPVHWPTLAKLRDAFDGPPVGRWDGGLRDAFFDLLRNPSSASALEVLDHAGAWPVLLPEWSGIRGRPQLDPYHRYTVDGHSYLAVEQVTRLVGGADPIAATAATEAGRLTTLYLGALLHDVGKGSGHDHAAAGEELARGACARIGVEPDEAEEVAALVRHHLLLPDTATRRDLDDGSVIASVAETIGSPRLLRLLYVLAAADGLATGPEAWSPWKQTLVRDLYRKALAALEKGRLPARSDVAARAQEVEAYEPALAGRAAPVLATLPPSYLESTSIADMVDEIRLLLDPPAAGEVRWRIEEGTESGQWVVLACVPNRPGALARTAGALALNRISILRAQAFSTTRGLALHRLIVGLPERGWDGFTRDLEAVYSGRLPLQALLERKARDYRPARAVEAEVRVLHDASPHSTVIEVRAPDALGLLYAIAAALGELDVDIRVAKIDTLAQRVVDVFYVRSAAGTKLSPEQSSAAERAITYGVRRLFAG